MERAIAKKLWIKDLLESKYKKEEGWQANTITTTSGVVASRINILGIIVANNTEGEFEQITLDDGTGIINARHFDQEKKFSELHVGSFVTLIGKPREFGSDKYVVCEIIKETNPLWMKYRRLELDQNEIDYDFNKETKEKKGKTKNEVLIDVIKELDTGEGVDISELMNRVDEDKLKEKIDSLLLAGEIFEVRKGRVKAL